MVDLSGGSDGPLEHAFSNTVFIIPGIIFVSLSETLSNAFVKLFKMAWSSPLMHFLLVARPFLPSLELTPPLVHLGPYDMSFFEPIFRRVLYGGHSTENHSTVADAFIAMKSGIDVIEMPGNVSVIVPSTYSV